MFRLIGSCLPWVFLMLARPYHVYWHGIIIRLCNLREQMKAAAQSDDNDARHELNALTASDHCGGSCD